MPTNQGDKPQLSKNLLLEMKLNTQHKKLEKLPEHRIQPHIQNKWTTGQALNTLIYLLNSDKNLCTAKLNRMRKGQKYQKILHDFKQHFSPKRKGTGTTEYTVSELEELYGLDEIDKLVSKPPKKLSKYARKEWVDGEDDASGMEDIELEEGLRYLLVLIKYDPEQDFHSWSTDKLLAVLIQELVRRDLSQRVLNRVPARNTRGQTRLEHWTA